MTLSDDSKSPQHTDEPISSPYSIVVFNKFISGREREREIQKKEKESVRWIKSKGKREKANLTWDSGREKKNSKL